MPRSTYPGTDWENKKQEINTLYGEVKHRFDNGWGLNLAATKSWQDAVFSGTYLSRYSGSLATTAYQSKPEEDQTAFDGFASGPFEAFGRTHELVVGASRREVNLQTREYSPYAL